MLSIMTVEVLAFVAAACIHLGFFAPGYGEHAGAAAAEIIIGMVLLLGLIGIIALPGIARVLSLSVQGFALLGTLVGIFTAILGVGPRTAPDLVFHILLVVLLVTGLRRAAGTPWQPFHPST